MASRYDAVVIGTGHSRGRASPSTSPRRDVRLPCSSDTGNRVRVDTDDQAIAIYNDTDYGLAMGVITEDYRRWRRYRDETCR